MDQQLSLHRQIGRFLENFRKIGRNNITAPMVRSRMQTIKEMWLRFDHEHTVLERSVAEASKKTVSYFSENIYEQTEVAYYSTLDRLAEILEEIEPTPNPHRSAYQTSARSAPSSFSLSHLPAIQLPPFDGNEGEWEQFRDKFTAVIINNPELHDFARMHFLTSVLRGRALECLSGLAPSAENFAVAWQTLKDRYDNKRRLISVHMSAFFNLPRLSRESAQDLQSLHGKVRSTLASLANLQRGLSELGNDFLVHIVLQHVDSATRRAWSMRAPDDREPHSFEVLDRFIAERIRALEDASRESPRATAPRPNTAPRVHAATVQAQSNASCPICKGRHFFGSCPKFTNSGVNQRRDFVRKHNRCFNCLSPKHGVRECVSQNSCRKCQKRHHTLLHGSFENENRSVACAVPVAPAQIMDSPVELNSLSTATYTARRAPVLLATARVRLRSSCGRVATVRALLDQGSEVTLVSERVAQMLRARRVRVRAEIRAVGCVAAGPVRCAVELSVSPPNSSLVSFEATAFVLKSLTSYAPRHSIDLSAYEYLTGLALADPEPFSRDPVDIILGSDLYSSVLCDGVRRGSVGQPIAQETVFGWIISGPIGKSEAPSAPSGALDDLESARDVISSCHCLDTLSDDLKRFWELEDVPRVAPRSPEDERCEAHFVTTHSRTAEGRYCVRIPFKRERPIEVGSSRGRAAQLLQTLHRRLQRDPTHWQAYVDFLREYESLGHMRRVGDASSSCEPLVYLPHHPVFRGSDSAVAVRVVFNASSATSNGTSINEHILAGPKLQTDLAAVIMRWRNFRFVYCADIAKMYRQILLDTRDVDCQRILWSENPGTSSDEFQLLTVTYGMACAPFLALRVLQQLRDDEGQAYPLASRILQNNCYVDDVLFGGDTLDEARRARDQVVSLLNRGCFPLRKWSSNFRALLQDIPEDHLSSACMHALAPTETIKVLGVSWMPSTDAFRFSVSLPDQIPRSKRSILSVIAKLFDPLGWVAPVIITAKIFMQSLWRQKVAWDDPLPSNLVEEWTRTCRGLSQLSGLIVPRWTGIGESNARLELHGFADASNSAYAAVVYCRVVSENDEVTVSLLTSKSRVAPIKPVSVPRLELCAAVMLARLMVFVRDALSFQDVPCYCWSDSRVVLAWLSKHPSQWKVFVSHRVHDIQTRLLGVGWRYVSSSDNPADCASRGLCGRDLRHHALWWHGPPWLAGSDEHWPPTASISSDESNLERRLVSLHVEEATAPSELFSRFSSWPRMIRVVAYIHRFVSACRRVERAEPASCVDSLALTSDECFTARSFILKALQLALFPSEIRILSTNRALPPKNSLLALSPFLDADGILRVGGRLSRSPFPFSRRHPILLSSHRLTDLLVDHAHLRSLHSGIQLTLNVLRRDFWIVRARGIVRRRIHGCVTCARERAATSTQLMAHLPQHRVSAPPRPFLHVGVDYAGPLWVRCSGGRGAKAVKSYISLFICLATRAIHLELVSDYSSRAFVNAFSRFSARRGLPRTVLSDNGTTFVGADKDLTAAFRSALRDTNFINCIASDGIEWKFIPPSAPHFGGLWEAGVKTVKHHLRRMMKNHTLTVEEMTTLLCRVEACVNSRPIAPLADSFDNYEPLTPGHFLIGSAITTHPEPSVLNVNENRLTRWQLVQHLTERFWHCWYNDYVNLLQQRTKWKCVRKPLKVGQLVLIRNSNLPPCKWDLGRITRCHPGADGLIRVATVKTASSELVRPIVQLCVLPIDCEYSDDSVKQAD